jgi:hypothetical protein
LTVGPEYGGPEKEVEEDSDVVAVRTDDGVVRNAYCCDGVRGTNPQTYKKKQPPGEWMGLAR